MNKKLLSLIAIPFLLYGCGDAGVVSDISKTSEVSYDVSAADLNLVVGSTQGQTVNFADEDFEEYLADVENYTMNFLKYEVSGLTGTPSSTIDIEIRIDFNNNTASATDGSVLLSVNNVPVANTSSPVTLFNTDATDPGLASASVIASIEQALKSNSAVEIEITASKSGADLSEDFTMKFLFDLTARVDLDQ